MKTRNIFISALVMTMGLVGCTSDFDENKESQMEKMECVKNRIQNIAAEYGLKSFSITDDALLENIDITDEEIESRIQMALDIQGVYVLKAKGKNRFGVTAKMRRKSPRRSPSDYDWEEEHHSGTFTNDDWKEDYGLTLDFSYEYGHDIHNSFACELHFDEDFCKKKKDADGKETEVRIISVKDIGSPNPIFHGDEGHLTISYTYMVEITYSDKTVERVDVSGSYTEDSGSGIATFTVL